jgi:uncharacterized protein (PEP-CTERM system associated)
LLSLRAAGEAISIKVRTFTGGASPARPQTLLFILLGSMLLLTHQAAAFPTSDAASPSVVPSAAAATADQSDASALAHQLSLLNGYSSLVGPGWNFSTSIGLQEALNDNIFQASTDRRWDLITSLSPGFAAYGDTERIQLRVNYQPILEDYARTPSLNQIAQSLSATSDITVWPEHVFLDLRASAGVGSTSGSTPGLGYGTNGAAAGAAGGAATGTTLTGLTKANSTQYTGYQASPYFLQSFDTYGTFKAAYTYAYETSSNTGSLLPISFSSTGGSSSETSNQELLQFTTGSFLERVSDTVLLNATQTQNTNAAATTTTGTLGSGAATGSFAGDSTTFTNQTTYVLNRSIAVFGTLGYESIDYGGTNSLAIHDITWQIGTTLTPNPRSTLTVSYGHTQGTDSLAANGVYQLTPRTSVNVSYGQALTTALQTEQQQLSQTAVNNSGVPVNSQTGAPLYTSNSLLGTQNQLYRSTTATIGTATQLDRDSITITAQYAQNTAAGAGAIGSTSGVTGTAGWTHSISPNLTLSASGSYGTHTTVTGGHSTFIALSASLSYALSRTVSGNLSYAFYDLNSTGQTPISTGLGGNSTGQGGSLYQDIVVLSLTKQF